MGIWRFAGAFAVVKRQGECGASRNENHVAQPKSIGVCYGLGRFCLIFKIPYIVVMYKTVIYIG